jgi:hypothetical protein
LYDPSPKAIPPADPLPRAATKSNAGSPQWIHVESASELRFTGDGENAQLNLMPLYQISDQRYSVYWQLQNQKGNAT